jgi:cell division protein FtsI (penicillin-binding protein 3)/stage V sporulation protein D (sporulation-specific penicillin-binding protein)
MNGRIRFISVVVILVAIVMLARLYFVQIVHGDSFVVDAERQYINQNTVSYNRGGIYFQSKNGENIPAAISRSGFTVSINPSAIADPEKIYTTLSKVLPLEKSEFMAKASKKDDPNEEVAIHLNEETADKIKSLNIYGVTLSTDKWRFYPGNKLAAQSIGFVGYNGDKLAGRYGLERYYEDVLKRDPSKAYNNFFAEFFSNVKESLSDNPQEEGSIVTTIEPSVELFLENELQAIRDKWGSDGAGGVIIDPTTGEIVALAWNPSFDPNDFKESNVSVFNNPIVEGVYEMGSIIKPITMASGLDSGTVSASSTYDDLGFLVLDKKRISNYDGRGRGIVDMQEVLNQSLNTGAAYVAMKMGNKKFSDYMKSFGVGTETGIDLPNEARGLINNLDSQRDIEMATAAYGQGVAFTPIATVRALSVLANGGTLITPHLVKKIDYENGLSKKMSFAPGKQVIKKETSEEITRMLVNVVDKALRGGTAKIPGVSVAAKTGTAQMTEEGRPGYVEGKYLHSFFGYFPAYKPRFLVFLFHLYPKNVRYASETLTDPFLSITKFLINYYQIPPDRPDDV